MWACQATVLPKHIDEGLIWRRARELIIMKIKVGTSSPNVPSSTHERTHQRSSSKEVFHVKWAHDEQSAVMPAQVVTCLETMESWDSETQLLARSKLVISFRLCRTAQLDLASAWKTQRFFCVWMLHGSTLPLSGRLPFCQLQMVKMSQQTLDENSTEATTSSKKKQYQPQSSLPESAKGG